VRPPETTYPDDIRLTELRQDPLFLVLPVAHALARKDSIAITDMAGEGFVMYPKDAGTGIYPQIFRLCKAAGFVPQVAQEAGEASTIIGLVAAGCGISVLPASFDRIRMDGVCYRPIADPQATTSLLLAQRKKRRRRWWRRSSSWPKRRPWKERHRPARAGPWNRAYE
jgi:DNA-binding transcriptional LysR family regulator